MLQLYLSIFFCKIEDCSVRRDLNITMLNSMSNDILRCDSKAKDYKQMSRSKSISWLIKIGWMVQDPNAPHI